MTFLLAVLAIFFVWEAVLSIVPWTIPGWLQPFLVYAAALGYCWPDWRIALAVSGAVGLVHVLAVRPAPANTPATGLQRPTRQTRLPNLP